MDEYIERKEAIAAACKGCNKEFPNEPCEPFDCHIQQGLFNIPAADVVEVVRCKDCKSKIHDNASNEDWCNNPGGLCCRLKYDYFCPFGERKDGE